MKVREMIEELGKLDGDLPVCIVKEVGTEPQEVNGVDVLEGEYSSERYLFTDGKQAVIHE